jgi:hypothetical protein
VLNDTTSNHEHVLLLWLLQVKKTTFAHADPDHVFGLKMAKDPEGAKEGGKATPLSIASVHAAAAAAGAAASEAVPEVEHRGIEIRS